MEASPRPLEDPYEAPEPTTVETEEGPVAFAGHASIDELGTRERLIVAATVPPDIAVRTGLGSIVVAAGLRWALSPTARRERAQLEFYRELEKDAAFRAPIAWGDIDPASFDGLAGLTALDVAENKAAHAVARVEGRLAQTPKDPALLLLAAGTYFATRDVQVETLLFGPRQTAGDRVAYVFLCPIMVRHGSLPYFLSVLAARGIRIPECFSHFRAQSLHAAVHASSTKPGHR